MTLSLDTRVPEFRKTSRAKLWIRTGILAVFGTLFGISLYLDIAAGRFGWYWGLITFLVCLPIGFTLRTIVPMTVHLTSQHITMSFDKVYFGIILALVLAKAVTGKFLHLPVWSDVLMCAILGLMVGRLSGICIRVRNLKVRHGFITFEPGDA